ncbi:MAG: hypothetical protein Q8K32_07055 [Archangium sp.]|nr:hypothetical protein [Archangium sp.]
MWAGALPITVAVPPFEPELTAGSQRPIARRENLLLDDEVVAALDAGVPEAALLFLVALVEEAPEQLGTPINLNSGLTTCITAVPRPGNSSASAINNAIKTPPPMAGTASSAP